MLTNGGDCEISLDYVALKLPPWVSTEAIQKAVNNSCGSVAREREMGFSVYS